LFAPNASVTDLLARPEEAPGRARLVMSRRTLVRAWSAMALGFSPAVGWT